METLSTMTTSPSSSDYSSTEDFISERKSIQSLSVGYYPSENTFSYEDVVSHEEAASANFLPPVQSIWGTESLRRLFRKRDQMEHDPEQFCKLSITLAWDIDVNSDHADALANLDLNGHSQWMDKWPEDKTKLTPRKLDNLVQKLETFLGKEKGGQHDGCVLPESTQKEDVHLNSSPPPHSAQVSHKDRDVCQDLSKNKALENEDICEVLENPPRLLKDEVEVSTEMHVSQESKGQDWGRQGWTVEPHSLPAVRQGGAQETRTGGKITARRGERVAL